MVQELIGAGLEVACVKIYKGWMEVDTFEDYQRAWATIRK
jgi:phosphoenolpyruvate phosphomutase